MNNVIGLMKVIFTSKTKEDFRKHNDYVRKQKKSEKVFQLSPIQYPDPGSNRDGLPHWCLRPARLPIPPSGQLFFSIAMQRYNNF